MDARVARAERGFSLLELMIAVVILGVITSQMFVALSTQQRSSTSTGRDMDLQEAARLVADLIAFDARSAGMMVPPEAAVASGDGGANAPDRFCVSASNYFQVDANTAFWNQQKQRFLGPDVTLVDNTTVTTNTVDVDTVNSANDWNPSGGAFQPTGIIIAQRDGRGSHCALVTNLVAVGPPPTTTYTFTLAHGLPAGPALAGALVAVPAIIYELQPPDPLAPPGTLGTLMRNGVVVSGQIEDLQVEYWVDTRATTATSRAPDGQMVVANDGSGEFPVHSLLGLPAPVPPSSTDATRGAHTPLSRIRNVRISVVARGSLPDVDAQGIARGRRPALGNRAAAAAADSFSRRMYSVSVLPRNLLRADSFTAVD